MNAIVFDMDGVLFDTERIYYRAWHAEGNRQGLTDEQVDRLFYRCAGHNLAAIGAMFREELGDGFDFDAFWKDRTECSNRMIAEAEDIAKPGLRELLDDLRARGWAIAVATSTGRTGTLFNLNRAGIADRFQILVTGDMFRRGKPDPEVYLRACELLGSDPAETYAVEDSYAGLESARKAGMRVVMIPDMFPPTEESKKNTDILLPSLFALREYLRAQHS